MTTTISHTSTRMVSIIFEVLWLIIIVSQVTNCVDLAQETRCLSCIRNVSSLMGIDGSKRCGEGYYCGHYQISYTYWAEAGKPGNQQGSRDFEKCARDKNCSEQTVRAYFKKFKRDCNNDGTIDCLDMAALHKAGPTSCSSDWFYKSRYWLAFNRTTCMNQQYELEQISKSSPIVDYEALEGGRLIKNQSLTTECLDCICDAVSGCNTSINNCGSGTVCGPFAISQAYWKDGRKPGASWTACARTKECSSVVMRNYMEKYKRDCNDDGYITCEDYAAIHRRGARACSNKDLLKDHYWSKFLACRANQKPTKDVNTVKVNENSDQDFASRLDINNIIPTSSSPPLSVSYSSQAPVTTFSAPTPASPQTEQLHVGVTNKSNATSGKGDKSDVYQVTGPSDVDSRKQEQQDNKSSNRKPEEYRPNHQESTKSSSIMVLRSSPLPSFTSTTSSPREPTMDHTSSSTSSTSYATTENTLNKNQNSPAVENVPEDQTQQISNSNTNNNNLQRPPFPPILEQPNLGEENVDYPNLEFPLPGHPNQPDRTSSFDKVVLGIVGNPDFSKSYPPVPADIQSSTPQLEPKQQPDNKVMAEEMDAKSQPKSVANQRPSTNSNQKQIIEAPQRKHHKQQLPPSEDGNNPMRNPPLPPPPLTTSTTESDTKLKDEDSGVQSSLGPIFGTESINMSSLFEKGGLNESSRIPSECLECICDASSNCDTTVQCISKQREKNRCGLYMISWNQYQESEISLTSLAPIATGLSEDLADEKMYVDCTTDRLCAEKLIHLYIEKHQKDCNNDGKIDCYDIAAIHRVGPENCNSQKFLSSQYWGDFSTCFATERLMTTTIQPLPMAGGGAATASSQ